MNKIALGLSGLTLDSSQHNLLLNQTYSAMLPEVIFYLRLPKNGNNETFPEGILKFRNINAEQHARDWLVSMMSHNIVFRSSYLGTVFAAG